MSTGSGIVITERRESESGRRTALLETRSGPSPTRRSTRMPASTTDLSELRRFAESVVVRLRDAGFEALFAGGCVRDLLLNRIPKDYDVATSAKPEQVQSLFR